MEEEKIIKYYRQILEDLTYKEWKKVKSMVDRMFDFEIKESIYSLKIDVSKYSDIDLTTLF